MAEDTRVRGNVSVTSDCKERVAFELMQLISSYEHRDDAAPRRYFLELYYNCLGVVQYKEPETVKEHPRNK
jgi:hypothetical protein